MHKEDVFKLKDKIQRYILNKWFLMGCRGSVVVCTGVGKSRIGVLAAEYVAKITNYDCKILIITPTEEIRDNAWVEEFTKWNSEFTFKTCVKIMCIHSACKLIGEHFDLVICDEYHNTIKPIDSEKESVFMQFYFNNTYNKLLTLSAYIPSKKRYWAYKIAPLVEYVSIKKAVELGLIAPFNIYNLPIEASEQELKILKHLNNKIEYEKGNGYKPWKTIGKRREFLSKLSSRYKVCKQISDYFGDKKGIIFTEYISDVINLQEMFGESAVSVHSKMKKKDRTSALSRYNSGEVNRIISAKALNEGVNLTNTNFGIAVNANGTIKDLVQECGRILRLDEEGKKASYIRLYLPDSQDYSWLMSSQAISDSIFVNSVEELFEQIEKNSYA